MIFAQIFDMLDVGIVILDRDLNVFKWNRWMAAHSRIPSEEIVGKPLFSFYPELNIPSFVRNCKSVFTFGNFAFFSQKLHKYIFPFKAYNILGSNFEFMQQSCTIGPLRDENNEIEYIYLTVQDVTEVAAYEAKLIEMNTRDALTGVYNRRYFESRLKEEFDRHKRYCRPLCMIILDIDHFKKINDTYGHQAGDSILKDLASHVMERIRQVDIFARYGGEEFCLILPETRMTSGEALAELLRKEIKKKAFVFKEQKIKMTVSQGISEISDTVDSADLLLKKADDALYEAKRTGRNKVVTSQ